MLAYAGVLRLSRWCRQNSHVACSKTRWWITACMHGNILYRLINTGVLQSAKFYLFRWLFWRTPSTLKIAKSSPPMVSGQLTQAFIQTDDQAITYLTKYLRSFCTPKSAHNNSHVILLKRIDNKKEVNNLSAVLPIR